MIIIYEGIEYNCSDKYSFKVLQGRDLTQEVGMSGKIIYASSFYHEKPDSEVLPSDLMAVFIKCNMDNIIIPDGVTLIDCTTRRFEVQEDGRDWILDEETDAPIERL